MEHAPRCCFTGHRPEKLDLTEAQLRPLLAQAIEDAISDGITTFLSGMARGVDIWAAEEVLRRKAQDPALRLVCALPFAGFEARWEAPWQRRYRAVLEQADFVHTCFPAYTPESFQARNRWMVARSRRLIAVYGGQPGGTRNTIRLALDHGLQLHIIPG